MESDKRTKFKEKPHILQEDVFVDFLDYYKICLDGLYKEVQRFIKLGKMTKEFKRQRNKKFEGMVELDKLLDTFEKVCKVLDEVLEKN